LYAEKTAEPVFLYVFKLALPALFCAFGAGGAQAASLDALELLDFYNVITVGDLKTGAEVEGNVYIGGDSTSQNSTQFDQADQTDDTNAEWADIVILGDQAGPINLVNTENSDVFIGGSYTGQNGSINNQGSGQTITTASSNYNAAVLNSSDVFSTLTAFSATLEDLDGDSAPVSAGGVQTFSAGVYDISMTDLTASNIYFDLESDEQLIINVSGTTISSNINFNNAAYADQIIWNFYEATDIFFGGQISGIILAPDAYISGFNGTPVGSIFAESINASSGEIHYAGVSEHISIPGSDTPLPSVPLPAGLPLLVGGFAAFGLMKRRKKQSA
jgi:choice-of-anchor A domain-containing protein